MGLAPQSFLLDAGGVNGTLDMHLIPCRGSGHHPNLLLSAMINETRIGLCVEV